MNDPVNPSSPPGIYVPEIPEGSTPLEHALALVAAGLQVITIHAPIFTPERPPGELALCTCGRQDCTGESSAGKHPFESNWQKKPLRDEQAVRDAFEKFAGRPTRRNVAGIIQPNIGTSLGSQADGSYVISIDVDSITRIAILEDELGELPYTATSESFRGYKAYFTVPDSIDRDRIKNVTGLGGEKGVDVKVQGGQVVAPPSMHAFGTRYTWVRTGRIAELPPAWLIKILAPRPAVPDFAREYTPTTLKNDRRAQTRNKKYLEAATLNEARLVAACGKGLRNTTFYLALCKVLPIAQGVMVTGGVPYVVRELSSAARACGLPDREIAKSVASAEKWLQESGAVRIPFEITRPPPDRQRTQTQTPGEPGMPGAPAPSGGEGGQAPGTGTALALVRDEPEPEPGTGTYSSQDQRPEIKLNLDNLEPIIDASLAALATEREHVLYRRASALVYVSRFFRKGEEQGTAELPEGSPQIHQVEMADLRERLTRVARYVKWSKTSEEYTPTCPPDTIASAVLARPRRGPIAGIRPLVGVAESPFMTPSGRIVQDRGYDRETGYLYEPSDVFPRVPESPTQDDAFGAYKRLERIFTDDGEFDGVRGFPFETLGHLSVPLAAALTVLCRPAIRGAVPAFLFNANNRGVGKSMLTDIIAILATGREMPRGTFPKKDEEIKKTFDSYALDGVPLFSLDNVDGDFGGDVIDAVLTAPDTLQFRPLGETMLHTVPWRAAICVTGNGISVKGDTADRVLRSNMRTRLENPRERGGFNIRNLLPWVKQRRTAFVIDLLTIAAAWMIAPIDQREAIQLPTWGSFQAWANLIPPALEFAGASTPMEARVLDQSTINDEVGNLLVVLEWWNVLCQAVGSPDGLSAGDAADALYDGTGPGYDKKFNTLRTAVEGLCSARASGKVQPTGQGLGRKLFKLANRPTGGKQLTFLFDKSRKISLYRVVDM